MKSAFGPYTDSRIYEPIGSMDKNDSIVVTACCFAMVALLVALFVWG
jgi:hypothetical protein